MHRGLRENNKNRLLIASFFVVLSLLTGSMNAHGEELADWAVIDREGQIVHTMDSVEFVGPFSESIMIVREKGSVRFLDENFKTIFQSDRFSIDSWYYWMSEGRIPYWDEEKRKYGFLDSQGNVVIQAEYDYVRAFSSRGYAVVAFGELPPEGSYAYGLIDRDGNRVLPMEYDELSTAGISKGKVLANKDGNEFIIDISKRPHVIHQLPEGTNVYFTHINDSVGFVFSNDGYGIMGWDGKEIIPPIFKAVWDRSPFGYVVKFEDELFYVIVDKHGNRVDVPEDIDIGIINLIGDKYVLYKEYGNVGLYDLSSLRVAIPAKYDRILSISYDEEGEIFAVKTKKGCGYIDTRGNAISKMEYDVCGYFSGGYAAVQLKPTRPY